MLLEVFVRGGILALAASVCEGATSESLMPAGTCCILNFDGSNWRHEGGVGGIGGEIDVVVDIAKSGWSPEV